MTEDEIYKIIELAQKHIDKKYKNDPSRMLRKQVANASYSVLSKISDISFEELAVETFMICEEVGFRYFSEKYSNVIEFAKLQPERLPEQLYKYLRNIAREIKKTDKLSEFFVFMSMFEEVTDTISAPHRNLIFAYLDLLAVQAKFLKPDIFDVNQLPAGLTTDGKIIAVRTVYPDINRPVYEIAACKLKGVEMLSFIEKTFRKYGYSRKEYDDLTIANSFFENDVIFLITYINEFTFDMLPDDQLNIQGLMQNIIHTESDVDLTPKLNQRKRTIPANGYIISFENSRLFDSIKLKEVYFNGSINLLCKISTHFGVVTVRYNTKNGFFFSPFNYQKDDGMELHNSLKAISMWLYATYVCPDELFGIVPSTECYRLFTDDDNAVLTFTSIGGKAKSVLETKTNSHLDIEKYEQSSVSVAGYIRKLPTGQNASEEKQRLARALGFDLDSDETYVEPFIKNVWKLKKVEK